jgi:hypothetical protein
MRFLRFLNVTNTLITSLENLEGTLIETLYVFNSYQIGKFSSSYIANQYMYLFMTELLVICHSTAQEI